MSNVSRHHHHHPTSPTYNMFTDTEAARDLFEAHVPHADATFLVLKAHLVLETSLLKFIEARLPEPLYEEISKSRELGYAGRILLARALAARDEVPADDSESLWPALDCLGALRNQLAHNLLHKGSSIEDKMRNFIRLVDPKNDLFGTAWNENHLFIVFRLAAGHLNTLLTLVSTPTRLSDLDLDSDG